MPRRDRRRIRLELALSETNTGVFDGDAETGEVFWDEGSERLYGYDPDGFPGTYEAFISHIHDEDVRRVHQAIATAVYNTTDYTVDFRIERLDGEQRWIQAKGVVQDDGSEIPTEIVGIQTDITERKTRERDLEIKTRQLERYRIFVENSSDALIHIRSDGTITYINGAETVTSRSPDEFIDEPFDKFVYSDDKSEVNEFLDKMLAGGSIDSIEYRFKEPNGSLIWLETTVAPITEQDSIGGLITISRDITERKERAQKLERSRQRYRSLFENNPLVLWEEDLSGAMKEIETLTKETDDLLAYLNNTPEAVKRVYDQIEVINVNQNAVEAYGADSKEELIEKFPDILTGESQQTACRLIVELADGNRRFRDETSYRTIDGELRHELIEATVPETADDDCSRVLIAGIDINERKQYEHRIEAHNRTLERLAEIISHDFQTPLSAAEKLTTLVDSNLDDPDPPVARSLDKLESVHKRLRTLTDHLPRLARESTNVDQPNTCELAAIAQQAWKVVDTDCLTLCVEDNKKLTADPRRLQQAFENLFQNTVEHGCNHEDATESDATTVRVGTFSDGIFVADDGPGVPTNRRDDIFEYGVGDRSGIGLSITQTIIEAHGWDISVTESDDGGARFEITMQ